MLLRESHVFELQTLLTREEKTQIAVKHEYYDKKVKKPEAKKSYSNVKHIMMLNI